MACRDIHILWQEYFTEPFQFQDNRNSKRGPRSPDFRHKQTREPLWVNDWHNPLWVKQELRRRGLQNAEDAQNSQDHSALFDSIKTCTKQKDLHNGSRIHADLAERGLLKTEIPLGNALLSMYAKCGALVKAQELFDELPARNVITWNALIAGYAQYGLGDEALNCFERMRCEGLSPTAVTFICILKACSSIGAAEKGEEIHAEVCNQGLLEKNHVIGTTLVDMYAKCGALAKAQEVFNELPVRDVVTWNALISGYSQNGLGEEALSCFGQMQDEGLSPSAVTYICILKACASIGAVKKGEEIHAEVSRQGLLEQDIVLGNALVDMYTKCGVLAKAQEVFDGLPARDVATWNVLISGHIQHGLNDEALSCYERMQGEGLSPDAVTFVCTLKACGCIGATEKGEEIHVEAGRQGLLEKDIVLGNALVDMYAKCGELAKAQGLCNQLPIRNVVTWTALIAGYAQHGFGDEALNCFDRMRDEGLFPNTVTYVSILKACGSIGAVGKGEEIHSEVRRQGLLDDVIGTALVDMYAKCGSLMKAQGVFDELPARSVVTWNALIVGYARHGLDDEALGCFERMRDEGISPDAVTFICTLNACGSMGAANKGEEIHDEVDRQRLLEKDTMLGNALVDMYSKCGKLAKAQEVFNKLPIRNVATWTALIAGYAQVGKVRSVFHSFFKMIGEGIKPNVVTFIVVLTACSHAGLVEEGQMYFDTMSTVYCIIPNLEHLACMLDIFSRAGQFDKAKSMVEKVPPSDRLLLWSTLMGACRNWENVDLGSWAFKHAIQLDENFDAVYVCMNNIYATAGMQEEADEVGVLRTKNGTWKIPADVVWTDVNRNVHSFTMGDETYSQSHCIYEKLNDTAKILYLE